MSKYNTACSLLALILATSFAAPASAQITDPDMTCAGYLKQVAATGPTPKTGDASMDKMAADLDKKVADYCKAHPTEKAMDAAMKALGG